MIWVIFLIALMLSCALGHVLSGSAAIVWLVSGDWARGGRRG